ncbi:MAG: amidohydrolase family protein, partial [Oscillospiraceae bacterium]|nr:amidohydrolase family protein [Oscillospiraceae bacterium]
MEAIFKNANVYRSGAFVSCDIAVSNGRIVSPDVLSADAVTFDCRRFVLLPGFVDVHVHLREPGFSYKETIGTGTKAAARGGYTAVCTMPNLNPTPDSLENLAPQREAIAREACIRVLPYGTITVGEQGTELSDMDALAPYVIAFSDDGRGVQNDD